MKTTIRVSCGNFTPLRVLIVLSYHSTHALFTHYLRYFTITYRVQWYNITAVLPFPIVLWDSVSAVRSQVCHSNRSFRYSYIALFFGQIQSQKICACNCSRFINVSPVELCSKIKIKLTRYISFTCFFLFFFDSRTRRFPVSILTWRIWTLDMKSIGFRFCQNVYLHRKSTPFDVYIPYIYGGAVVYMIKKYTRGID